MKSEVVKCASYRHRILDASGCNALDEADGNAPALLDALIDLIDDELDQRSQGLVGKVVPAGPAMNDFSRLDPEQRSRQTKT